MKTPRHLLALAALAAATATAQVTNSPYSKQGYGLLNDNASGIQRQMGGVGYAMQSGRAINVMNPASYSQVDSLTFLWDIGLDMNHTWSTEGGLHGYNLGGGLDYLTAQFRLAKRLGASLGLLPYASTGYTYTGIIDDGVETRTGSGGLQQLYLGAGYEPLRGLSVGANVAYLFGTINNTNAISASSITYYQRTMEVRDWTLTLGAQYALQLTPADRLTVGVAWSPRKSMHGHAWGTVLNSQDTKADTLGYTSMSGKYEQPHTVGVGVNYNRAGRWIAEADLTWQNWKDAKYSRIEGFEAEAATFNNRWKAAAGLQFSPNKRGSYLGAMAFRAGAFYNHDYMTNSGNNVRDYGLTAGVGLPVPGGKTTVNLGLEWRHRTTSPTVMIREDYLNITLSVNFNELWFWKSKIR